MIEIKNLNKSFKDLSVLEDINLTINTGEIFGIVGRSGAGKSTLLRCINGLETYDSGSLLVDGEEVRSKNPKEIQALRKDMGMIFQNFSLIERRTVFQNVALPLKCWKHNKVATESKVKELLDLVQISDKMDQRPSSLSGGQKQRVAIARALALNPKILLCDEATSALDPKTTKSVLSLLKEINSTLGLTIIIVTHQMEVVRNICDRMAILENGVISAYGKVEDIFLNQPESLKNLIGSDNINYPNDGINISFLSKENDSSLISYLSIKYGEDIKIVSANSEKYRDTLCTIFTINTSSNNSKLIIEELTQRGIHWKIINE